MLLVQYGYPADSSHKPADKDQPWLYNKAPTFIKGASIMKITPSRVILAIIACVVCILSIQHKLGANSTITDTELKSYIAELTPKVESISGKKFKSAPKCKLITPEGLTKILIDDYNRTTPKSINVKTRRDAIKGLKDYAKAQSSAIYISTTKTVYLLPENINLLLANAGINPKSRKPVIKVMLAHEMTHALQDQELDSTKMTHRAKTPEQAAAIQSVIEGQARFVDKQIAASLNIQSIAEAARIAAVFHPNAIIDVADKIGQDQSQRYGHILYQAGFDFITWHYKHGGNDEVWQVVANPPLTTSEVTHPEQYGKGNHQAIDYTAVLDGLQNRFGKRKWSVENAPRDEFEMRSKFAAMDPKVYKGFFENVKHVQMLTAQNGPALVNIRLYIIGDTKLTVDFLSQLMQMDKKKMKSLESSSQMRSEGYSCTDFTGIAADVAKKETYSMTMNGQTLSNTVLTCIRGGNMVQIWVSGIPSSDKAIADVIEEVFQRLDRVKRSTLPIDHS